MATPNIDCQYLPSVFSILGNPLAFYCVNVLADPLFFCLVVCGFSSIGRVHLLLWTV